VIERVARQLLSFAFVGTVGFLVDAAVLYLLKGMVGLYWGRLGSFLVAVLATWLLNRRITFRDRRSGIAPGIELAGYLLLMLLGALANLGVYTGLVLRYQWVREYPVFGVAAGSLAGMVLNFTSARQLLFRQRRDGGRL
jgi:putative flippase GtrA